MCRQEIIHLEIFDWYQIGVKLLYLTNIVKELLVMQNAGRFFYIKSYDTKAASSYWTRQSIANESAHNMIVVMNKLNEKFTCNSEVKNGVIFKNVFG